MESRFCCTTRKASASKERNHKEDIVIAKRALAFWKGFLQDAYNVGVDLTQNSICAQCSRKQTWVSNRWLRPLDIPVNSQWHSDSSYFTDRPRNSKCFVQVILKAGARAELDPTSPDLHLIKSWSSGYFKGNRLLNS